MKLCNLFESQNIFKTIMNSMASPGTPHLITFSDDVDHSIFYICQTLLDIEVTFSVIGQRVEESFINSMTNLTHSRYVDSTQADFVIICGGSNNTALQYLNTGTLEFPEKSATVLYIVDDNTRIFKSFVKIRGPGIKEPYTTTLTGITNEELVQIKKLNSEYPLGIDLIICDKNEIRSIPRTTIVDLQ